VTGTVLHPLQKSRKAKATGPREKKRKMFMSAYNHTNAVPTS
jgi:hypothetical protein